MAPSVLIPPLWETIPLNAVVRDERGGDERSNDEFDNTEIQQCSMA